MSPSRPEQEQEKALAHMDSTSESEQQATASPVAPTLNGPHSPLPWRQGPHYRFAVMSREGMVAKPFTPQGEADAAFIVRACNNFDALLAALKALFDDDTLDLAIGGNPHHVARVIAQCKAAIAKAEGR